MNKGFFVTFLIFEIWLIKRYRFHGEKKSFYAWITSRAWECRNEQLMNSGGKNHSKSKIMEGNFLTFTVKQRHCGVFNRSLTVETEVWAYDSCQTRIKNWKDSIVGITSSEVSQQYSTFTISIISLNNYPKCPILMMHSGRWKVLHVFTLSHL